MTLSTRVAHNTIIQIISKIISTVLGLAAVAIMARYLGQTGFGQYTIIFTFLSFFAIISDFGLTLVTAQMISRPDADEEKILNNLFSLRLFSAVVFLAAAPLLVIFFPYDPAIKLGVALGAATFLFIALNQIIVGLFQKNLSMGRDAAAEIISRLFLVAGTASAVFFHFGLMGMIGATVFSSAANFFLHYFFSRKFFRLRLAFDRGIWKEIFKKTWPLALTIAFNLVYLKADTLILSLVKTQAEVGIYGAAYKVIDVLVSIPFMFAGVILPILALSWAEGNHERFAGVFQKSFDVLVIMAAPLMVGTQFVAGKTMTLIAGDEFTASGPVLRLLIAAAGLIFLNSMFAHGIIAMDKQKKVIGAYIFTGITAVAGYLIFIPRYSYFGAAAVTIYSELAVAVASAYIFRKYAAYFPNGKIFAKAAAASLLMGLVLYLLPPLNLFFLLLSASFSYFLFLYVLKGLNFVSFKEIIFGSS